MKVQFVDDGVLDSKVVFKKDCVYDLGPARYYFWLLRGIVNNVPDYEGEVLFDPLADAPIAVKVDEKPIKGENKVKSLSSRRGTKSNEHASKNVFEDL